MCKVMIPLPFLNKFFSLGRTVLFICLLSLTWKDDNIPLLRPHFPEDADIRSLNCIFLRKVHASRPTPIWTGFPGSLTCTCYSLIFLPCVLESPWTSFFPTFNFSPFLTWYSTFFQELPKKGEWEVIWKPCASDYFYSSSLDIHVGWFYKIPGWEQFSFWIVKVLARCLLDSSVPIKSKAILIPDLCKRWWWFLSGNVKNFLSVQEISYWCALLGLCFHPLCWPPGGPLKSGNSCPVTESGDREKYYCGNDVLPFEFCVLFLEIRIHNLDTGPLFL